MHKGDSYPGEHDAIIDRETWDRVHAILPESARKRAARARADTPALQKGLQFGTDGAAFSPTRTRKGQRLTATMSIKLCLSTGQELVRSGVSVRVR